ncbi:MAG: Ig-like domain-containing protein, partial [Gemmatimonadetes bacterium]|nr:Ig-like domain-containing protein [Gemmatimonadota bacterium]
CRRSRYRDRAGYDDADGDERGEERLDFDCRLSAVGGLSRRDGQFCAPHRQTTRATATVRDAQGNVLTGRPVTWSSSTPAVATVSTTGLITAVAPGTVTVAATSEGVSGTSPSLSVVPVPVAAVTVSLGSTSLGRWADDSGLPVHGDTG